MIKYLISTFLQLVFLLWESNAKSPQDWIYSPQYSKIVQAKDSQSFFSQINLSPETGLLFNAAGDAGVTIIDPANEFKATYSFKSTENIMGLIATKDSNYVFFSYNSKLTIFDYSNRKEFVQVGQDSAIVQIMDVRINDAEDLIFIFQINGQVRILDISDKKSPTLAATILWEPTQIYGSFVSIDDKWIGLSQDNKGLGIFSFIKSGGTVSYALAGYYLTGGSGNKINSHQALISPDGKYIYNIDYRNGISIADFTVLTSSNPNTYPKNDLPYLIENWWPSNVIVPSPASIVLSSDGNFLFIGVRSIGIYTVDVSIKTSPIFYQWSYFPFHGNSIVLSSDEKYLYFSNSKSIMSFRRMAPILGTKYINMYNKHLSIGYKGAPSIKYYWRCDVDPTRDVYIGAFNTDGYSLIDVSDPINFKVIKSQEKPDGQTPVDTFYIKNDYKTMLVPINDGTNFFSVLDITNYNSVTEVYKIPYGGSFHGYVKDQDNNSDGTLLACALEQTVVFVDTGVHPYHVVAKWSFQPQMKGFLTGVMISSNNQYLVGACRGYGYFILDISDILNIKYLSYQDSTGAEQVYKSENLKNLYYFVDGLQGIFMMDQTKLPSFTPYSQVLLEGWTNDVTFLNQEKIIIVSTMQQGMVYLIDISNLYAPFVVSSYEFGIQNGMFTCMKKDFSTLYINNNQQVRSIPVSTQVFIHADFIEINGYKENGDMDFKIIDTPDIFYVGQTIKINFCFLYQPLDLVVSNVYLYQQLKKYDIPYWMKYDPIELSLVITILKEAIDPLNVEAPLLNTLVIKTLNPLFSNDFIFTSGNCITNPTKSAAIYKYLQNKAYLDPNSLVSPDLSFNDLEDIFIYQDDSVNFPNTTPGDKLYNICLSKLLKYTLLNSIQLTPIYVQFASSLTLDLSGSASNYIQTKANQVTILIEIQKFSGQFIFVNQQSVNIQINDEKNMLSVTGLVDNINTFLNSKIIIYPLSPKIYTNITAEVTISDSMNYPIIKSHSVDYFPFLVEKKNIKINPNITTLQNQFSDEIEIITDFSFTIDEKTFLVPDFATTVVYTALVEKDGEFVEFDDQHWLQYNPNLRKFHGSPPQIFFKTSVKVQVTGTDGYTKISDTFTIHITRLPVLFVLQWIATILGPITGAFGMYKYRNVFYNIYFKKKNRYASITLKPNELFMLKIPVIIHEQRAALQILNELSKKIQQKKISHITQQENENNDAEQQNQLINDQFPNQTKKQSNVLKKLHSKITDNVGKLKNLIIKDISSIASVYKKRIQQAPSSNRSQLFENLYLKKNGQLDINLLIKDIIEQYISFKIKNENTSTKSFREELNNERSTLHESIKYQLAKILITHDQKSFLVYSFLQHFSDQKSPQLTKNDWYKCLVNIQSDDELDVQGHSVTFPNFSLNFNNFLEALTLLGLFKVSDLEEFQVNDFNEFIKDKLFTLLQNQEVNLYLVELALFADAAGIQEELPSSFFPCCGESIHIEPHLLKSIVALKYNPGGYCFNLKKLFGLDYQPYGPQGNMQLPSWLQLEMQPGVIIMKGIPEVQNVEDVLIRFYTIQGYIVRYFLLRVEEDKNELLKLQELSKSKSPHSHAHLVKSIHQQQTDNLSSSEQLNKYKSYKQNKLIYQQQQRDSHFSQQVGDQSPTYMQSIDKNPDEIINELQQLVLDE